MEVSIRIGGDSFVTSGEFVLKVTTLFFLVPKISVGLFDCDVAGAESWLVVPRKTVDHVVDAAGGDEIMESCWCLMF